MSLPSHGSLRHDPPAPLVLTDPLHRHLWPPLAAGSRATPVPSARAHATERLEHICRALTLSEKFGRSGISVILANFQEN